MPGAGFDQTIVKGLAASLPIKTSLAKNSTCVTLPLRSTAEALAVTVMSAGSA